METLTLPELPPGWHIDGIWHDGFERDGAVAYSADASFPISGDSQYMKHIEVSSKGASMQAALDGLRAACEDAIRNITESAEWVANAHARAGA